MHRWTRRASFLLVPGLVATGRPAAAEPLWQAELRMGYGLAVSGSGTAMSTRASPLMVAATIAMAVEDTPPLAGYGGLVVETLDRNAAGAVFGVRMASENSRLRLAGGGIWLIAPYSIYGATASVGACTHLSRRVGLCGDVQLTAYIAGSDLADGHTVTQGQLVAGMVFDGP